MKFVLTMLLGSLVYQTSFASVGCRLVIEPDIKSAEALIVGRQFKIVSPGEDYDYMLTAKDNGTSCLNGAPEYSTVVTLRDNKFRQIKTSRGFASKGASVMGVTYAKRALNEAVKQLPTCSNGVLK